MATHREKNVKKDVIETVLDEFITRIENDTTVQATVVRKLKELTKSKEFTIEKLKAALFAEDEL